MINDITASEIISSVLTPGLRIALVLLVAYLANRFSLGLVKKITERLVRKRISSTDPKTMNEKRIETLKKAFGSIFSTAIWIIAILTLLPVFGINIAPVLAVLGVGGLALGLASQAIIKDYISGIMILLEDQYRVGEKIEAGGKTGYVEDFNLRRTVLRGENNELFYVPNSQIIVTANFKR
ncbi:MAG: mechanosensitive ion channel [bacterium]|nr:mechanosensitive ion channel [bacterium]